MLSTTMIYATRRRSDIRAIQVDRVFARFGILPHREAPRGAACGIGEQFADGSWHFYLAIPDADQGDIVTLISELRACGILAYIDGRVDADTMLPL